MLARTGCGQSATYRLRYVSARRSLELIPRSGAALFLATAPEAVFVNRAILSLGKTLSVSAVTSV